MPSIATGDLARTDARASVSAADSGSPHHDPAVLDAAAVPQSVGQVNWPLWFALLASVCAWVVVWYGTTFASMAEIWWNSETFAHGLVVYPMAIWLVWRARADWIGLQPRPCAWALIPIAGAGFGWLVADAGGVQAGQHLCAVVLLALVPWAVLGTRVARVIAFPLAFTLFAAPLGEFLMPILMEHTADFTVLALRMTGIPVYREGLNFMVPTGNWSVVEACSGLRYLIASVMLGCLFAYLTYRSTWRRIAFIAVSAIVPIIANWLRAYMIVMIGHFSGMKHAVGVDHLIYGWAFFGVVMLLIFWIGSIWREDLAPTQTAGGGAFDQPAGRSPSNWAVPVVLLVAVVSVMWPAYAEHLEINVSDHPPVLAAPVAGSNWRYEPDASPAFHPHYSGARARLTATYSNGGGRVGLFVGYYYAQSGGTELINFHNTIVPSRDPQWSKVQEGPVTVVPDQAAGVQTRLRGAAGSLTVWHWYWVGGRWTARREEAKILQAITHLLGRGDDAAVVVIHSEASGDGRDVSPERLGAFAREMLPAIESVLRQARAQRLAGTAPARSVAAPEPGSTSR